MGTKPTAVSTGHTTPIKVIGPAGESPSGGFARVAVTDSVAPWRCRGGLGERVTAGAGAGETVAVGVGVAWPAWPDSSSVGVGAGAVGAGAGLVTPASCAPICACVTSPWGMFG